jgi:hypothetical protein
MQIGHLLERFNVPHILGGTHQHVRPGWIGVDCPWCGTKGKWHLGISDQGQVNCWLCGRHRLGDALMQLTGAPCGEVKGWLEGIRFVRRSARPRGQVKLPPGIGPMQQAHRRYLERRGFDPDKIERFWGVSGIGLEGRELAWRLFIPITYEGELVSWTTRAIGSKEPRYVNASPEQESTSPNALLYGADYARSSIAIVEGPTDVWRIGPGAVAVLGLSYTRAQLGAILRYPKRVICFDADPPARRRARQLRKELSTYPGETRVVRLSSGDVGDASPEDVGEIRCLLDW